MHPLVVVCLAWLLVGVALAAMWGRLQFVSPPSATHASFVGQFKRAVWFLDIGLVGGVVGGLLAAGVGGRLAMRLLAATAGDAAQGQITEADQVVGEITVGGTIAFVVFSGLFAGLLCALIYLLLRKWLPPGWVGGLALGGLLLVAMGSRVEPLRSNNPDFQLVGPAWLAVLVFVALAFFHVLLCFAVMARMSRSLPLFAATPRVLLAYVPLVLLVPVMLTGVGGVALVVIVAGGAAVSMLPAVRSVWGHPRLLLVGRVLIVAAGLACLPSFAASIAEIL